MSQIELSQSQKAALHNHVVAVQLFMRGAGQSVAKFNATQVGLYTGLSLEELGEKIEVIAGGAVTPQARANLLHMALTLKNWSGMFKSQQFYGDILRADREGMADADVDLSWVALGSLQSICRDPSGSLAEVAKKNFEKFPGGQAYKDADGKVTKPPGWTPPNHAPYIDDTGMNPEPDNG